MDRREFGRLGVSTAIMPPWFGAADQTDNASRVRFSFMLWALAKLMPFDRCLDIVSEAGYQGVELVGEFQTWSPEERTRILARMRSLKLVVDAMSGVKAGFAVPTQTEGFRAQFIEHLRFARQLECPKVILLSGNRVEGLAPEAQHQASVENLKWASGRAAQEQIDIVIEPIDLLENPKTFLATVTDAFAIARAVNSPSLKVLYDVYHEQRSFGNLLEKFENNANLVGLVHIADVPGRHEPGTGEIDYSGIYRKLAALEYDHWITMEYYPIRDPLGSLKDARLEALLEFTRR
jgi:hydroxypyruvate isomerase